MTYCAEETNLIASAGRQIAEKLLPEPFGLQYSDHDTGRRMRIFADGLLVWQGSVWHSSIYEFNDRGHIAGLQPDFEFARPIIDKYFSALAEHVAGRKATREALAAARAVEAEDQKRAKLAAIREQVRS